MAHRSPTIDAGDRELADPVRTVLDGLMLVAAVLDPAGRTLYCNDFYLRLTGFSRDEILGRDWFATSVPGDKAAQARAALDALTRSGASSASHEYELVTRAGERRMVRWSQVAQYDAAGRPVTVTSVGEDITGRRPGEGARRPPGVTTPRSESEVRLRVALSSSNQATYDLDLQTGRSVVDPAYAVMLGHDPSTFEETMESAIERMHPDDRRRVFEAYDAYVRGGLPAYQVELRMQTANGAWKWISVNGTVVERDATGKPRRLLGTHTDISERKAAEAKRAELEAQLRQAQKMEAVGRLAGGIAHDFNNLLSVVLSYTDLILAEIEADSPLRDDIQEIHKAGQRAATLTRQLLAFSRQQVLEPRVLDLNEVVTGVQRLLQRVLGEDVELQSHLGAPLDPVMADPGQLEQVLMNLVVNARDAMPLGGTLTIETKNLELDLADADANIDVKPGSYVMLAVTDTGIGMGPETIARLFEPFFTTKEKGRGTGLGLATVFGIVKQSGGSVTARSELGRGATFEILLPSASASRVKPRSGPYHRFEDLSGHETILLVEDEGPVRAVARSILRKYGYVVLEAGHGGEAMLVSAAHEGHIDLLLTDVLMPTMGGIELAKRLGPLRPTMKILCMSGYTQEAFQEKDIAEEGFSFLQKPFSPELLARKVREALLVGTEPG